MDRKEQACLCLLFNTNAGGSRPVHSSWYCVFHSGLENCPVHHGRSYCFCVSLYLVCTDACIHFCLTSHIYFMMLSSLNRHVPFHYFDRFIPESARWLLDRGKTEQARKLILKAAAINKRTVPDRLLEKVHLSIPLK